jgi:hypothetical protein
MKERPRKWFHETTELALSLTPYIAPERHRHQRPSRFCWHLPAAAFSQGVARSVPPFPSRATMPVVSIGNMPTPFRRPSEEAQRMVTTGAPTSVRRSGLGWRSRSQMSASVRTISPVVASTISTDQASQ